MAKYEVTFSCGHLQEVELFGKHKERDRKVEWYQSTGVCSACFKAQKDAELREISTKIAEASTELGLPALTGSEKQVVWAEILRQQRIKSSAEDFARFYERHADLKDRAEPVLDWLLTQTSAKWWIDNRNEDTSVLLCECPAFFDLVRDFPGPFARFQIVIAKHLEAQVAKDEAARIKRLEGSSCEKLKELLLKLNAKKCVAKVWKNEQGVKRVYVEIDGRTGTYHHTGDKYTAKGTFEFFGSKIVGNDADGIVEVLSWLCDKWGRNQFTVAV